jgi:hypothetical protein
VASGLDAEARDAAGQEKQIESQLSMESRRTSHMPLGFHQRAPSCALSIDNNTFTWGQQDSVAEKEYLPSGLERALPVAPSPTIHVNCVP